LAAYLIIAGVRAHGCCCMVVTVVVVVRRMGDSQCKKKSRGVTYLHHSCVPHHHWCESQGRVIIAVVSISWWGVGRGEAQGGITTSVKGQDKHFHRQLLC